jgi:hypothetical protein
VCTARKVRRLRCMTHALWSAAAALLLRLPLACARRQAPAAASGNHLCTASGGRTALDLVRATVATLGPDSASVTLELRDGGDAARQVEGGSAALQLADQDSIVTGRQWLTPTTSTLTAPAGAYTLRLRRLEFEPYRLPVRLRAGFADTVRGSWRRMGTCGWFDPVPR